VQRTGISRNDARIATFLSARAVAWTNANPKSVYVVRRSSRKNSAFTVSGPGKRKNTLCRSSRSRPERETVCDRTTNFCIAAGTDVLATRGRSVATTQRKRIFGF
jgi:hypothetical protein